MRAIRKAKHLVNVAETEGKTLRRDPRGEGLRTRVRGGHATWTRRRGVRIAPFIRSPAGKTAPGQRMDRDTDAPSATVAPSSMTASGPTRAPGATFAFGAMWTGGMIVTVSSSAAGRAASCFLAERRARGPSPSSAPGPKSPEGPREKENK